MSLCYLCSPLKLQKKNRRKSGNPQICEQHENSSGVLMISHMLFCWREPRLLPFSKGWQRTTNPQSVGSVTWSKRLHWTFCAPAVALLVQGQKVVVVTSRGSRHTVTKSVLLCWTPGDIFLHTFLRGSSETHAFLTVFPHFNSIFL